MQDELDFVQSYIGLESGRVGEEFTASVVVEEGLDAKSIMIPSMIVQIPVENAIKHGLAGKDGEKELTIRISREGTQIFEGPLASLKRFKDDVKEVKAGYECGFVFANFNDIKEGDLVEAFEMVEIPR